MTFSTCCEETLPEARRPSSASSLQSSLGELLEVAGGELVRHDVGAELGGAEDVIPVGMGQNHVAGLPDSVLRQEHQELAGMRR